MGLLGLGVAAVPRTTAHDPGLWKQTLRMGVWVAARRGMWSVEKVMPPIPVSWSNLFPDSIFPDKKS